MITTWKALIPGFINFMLMRSVFVENNNNLSILFMYSSIIWRGSFDKYWNTGQTCFIEFNTSHAAFLPMPQKDETAWQSLYSCRNKMFFDNCSPNVLCNIIWRNISKGITMSKCPPHHLSCIIWYDRYLCL